MAPRCGTRAESEKTRPNSKKISRSPQGSQRQLVSREVQLGAFAGLLRSLGFFALAGAAVAIMAGVILLPPYARLRQAKYQYDCDSRRIDEARATVVAMDRLLAAGPCDEVLTRRLAWSRLGMYPSNEQIPVGPVGDALPAPGTLSSIRYEDPPMPNPWLGSLAVKLQKPSQRRGGMVMAGCLALSAMLMFGPPIRRKTKQSLTPNI